MLSDWLRAQLVLSFSMGVLAYVAIFIVETVFSVTVPSHFALASLVALAEFVPYVGPFLALVPALFLTVPLGAPVSVSIAIAYLAIQQLESLVLVPKVMGKSVDVSDVWIVIGLSVFASLFGILGVFFTVPLVAAIRIVFLHLRTNAKIR